MKIGHDFFLFHEVNGADRIRKIPLFKGDNWRLKQGHLLVSRLNNHKLGFGWNVLINQQIAIARHLKRPRSWTTDTVRVATLMQQGRYPIASPSTNPALA